MNQTIKQREALARAMRRPIRRHATDFENRAAGHRYRDDAGNWREFDRRAMPETVRDARYIYADEARQCHGLDDARPDLLMTAGKIAGAWRALKRAVWKLCTYRAEW